MTFDSLRSRSRIQPRTLLTLVSILTTGACCLLSLTPARAQVVLAPNPPVIGSSTTISADPPVAHPNTTPCEVDLFTNLEFADFNTKNFTYTPPKGCAGPWGKVVFTVDFTVTAGRQYDRTAEFYLGGSNIFFGTTAEPRAALSPSWHVERDVTDLSAIFKASQAGTALIGNYVGVYDGVDYSGIIYANAKLLFYPAERGTAAPIVPDVVIGMPGNSGAATLGTTTSQLTQSVTLPTNVERAYLDVIAQSQSNDEFWYLCVPNDQATPLESCGNTGFRETEISIDGIPAGVAPVYPWVYTGGIDPYLWEPIPGVQTLNFKPFRVDLTPFAGVLSNGQAHTVAISVFNADSYFAATGNLLIYRDKNAAKLTGELVSNTLTAEPAPTVKENIVTDASGNISGTVDVRSKHVFTIVGNVHTSHGLVTTTVYGDLDFANTQSFIIDAIEYKQVLQQRTKGYEITYSQGGGENLVNGQQLYYPFNFTYDQIENPDGTFTIANISEQQYKVTSGYDTDYPASLNPTYEENVSNDVSSTDYLEYDVNGNFTGHHGFSSQTYLGTASDGSCYGRILKSTNAALISYRDGAGCPGNKNVQ